MPPLVNNPLHHHPFLAGGLLFWTAVAHGRSLAHTPPVFLWCKRAVIIKSCVNRSGLVFVEERVHLCIIKSVFASRVAHTPPRVLMMQTCSFLLKSYAQELCVLSDDGMLGKTLDRKTVSQCANGAMSVAARKLVDGTAPKRKTSHTTRFSRT